MSWPHLFSVFSAPSIHNQHAALLSIRNGNITNSSCFGLIKVINFLLSIYRDLSEKFLTKMCKILFAVVSMTLLANLSLYFVIKSRFCYIFPSWITLKQRIPFLYSSPVSLLFWQVAPCLPRCQRWSNFPLVHFGLWIRDRRGSMFCPIKRGFCFKAPAEFVWYLRKSSDTQYWYHIVPEFNTLFMAPDLYYVFL